MTEKPEQYYDAKRHQLYYQWRESEHYVHQEPIYDRTRDYIESLKAENAKLRAARDVWAENDAKLRELVKDIYVDMWALGEWLEPYEQRMRDLGIEVD